MSPCAQVPHGAVQEYDGPSLHLLTVKYTYWPNERQKWGETSTGKMYLFGDYDSLETQNYLLREFSLRHPFGRINDFTLINKQP